jgi:ribonuclease HII
MVGITDSERRRRADGPTLTAEAALIARHGGPVAGIDEAGRGPWAGPVVAAAVILDPDRIPSGLNDSKLLSPRLREALYDEISATARVAVGIAEVPRIDAENILQATLWAMRAALRDLGEAPAAALVDGNRCPDLPCPARALVGGDGLSVSVAAASIVAKVTRDRLMIALADECPGYGWERNKGYGTREHGEALQRLGVTRHHRRSFAPVRAVIENGG